MRACKRSFCMFIRRKKHLFVFVFKACFYCEERTALRGVVYVSIDRGFNASSTLAIPCAFYVCGMCECVSACVRVCVCVSVSLTFSVQTVAYSLIVVKPLKEVYL